MSCINHVLKCLLLLATLAAILIDILSQGYTISRLYVTEVGAKVHPSIAAGVDDLPCLFISMIPTQM